MDKPRLLLVGILAVLPFVCYWEVLKGDVLLPMDWVYEELEPWREVKSPDSVVNSRIKDAFIESYALDAVSARAAREGRILLWNPYAGGGMPHLAGGFSRMLLPTFWLHAVLGPETARNLEILLYLFLAELFAFAFLRRVGCNVTGAFLGAVVYGFTPSLVHRAEISFILATLIWFPLLLYFVEAILTDGRLRFVAGLAVAVALQILAGYFPDIFINFLGAAVYGVIRAMSLGAASVPRRVFLCGAGALLGACLAGPFLLPALELIQQSNRPVSSADALLARGLGPSVFLTLFSPWLTRSQLYIGLLPLLFVPAAFRTRPRGPVVALSAVVLVGIVIATANPILALLHDVVPAFQGLRYTSTMIALAAFGLALLAGVGLSASSAEDFGIDRPLAWVLAFGLGVVGAWGLFSSDGPLWSTFRLLGALVLVICFVGGRALLSRRLIGARTFAVLLCILIAADLMSYARKFNPRTDPEALPPMADFGSIRFLREDPEHFRVATLFDKSVFWPNSLGAYGIEDIAAYHSLLPGQLGRYMERTRRYLGGARGEDLFEDRETSGNWVSLGSFRPSHLLRVWNIKYFIVPAGVENPDPEWLDLVYDNEVRILRFRGYLPRAFMTPRAMVLPSQGGVFGKLVDSRFDPQSTVLLETEPLCHFQRVAATAGGSREPRVVVREDEDTSIRIETSFRDHGFLFLSVSHDPGWKAELDGKPVPVLRANFNFQAVVVPSGNHEVEFRYAPASYRWGWITSLMAGVCVCLLIWLGGVPRPTVWAVVCFVPSLVAPFGLAHSRGVERSGCGNLQVAQRFFSTANASPVDLVNGITQGVSLPFRGRMDWIVSSADATEPAILRVRAAPFEKVVVDTRTIGVSSDEETILTEDRFVRGNRWTSRETVIPVGTERIAFEASAPVRIGSPLLLRPGAPLASEILFDVTGDVDAWKSDFSELAEGRHTTILLTAMGDEDLLPRFDEAYRADDAEALVDLMLRLVPQLHRVATVLVVRPGPEQDAERQLQLLRWELEKLELSDEVELRAYR